MNYEQKYKEALERMKSWVRGEHPECFSEAQKTAEFIFPELAESEDERIRKELIRIFKGEISYTSKEDTDKYIAWLEKQGEQKLQGKSTLEAWEDMRFEVYQQASGNRHEPNYSNDTTKMFSLNDIDEIIEKITEQKTTDKVEPKFHEGEWITDGDYTWKILGIKPLDYILQSQDGNIVDDTISYVNEQFHSFTIQDAKDGDILMAATPRNCPFIYRKTNYNNNLAYYYAGINGDGNFCEGCLKRRLYHFGPVANITPATKEQCDLLFRKMKEAGYKWDAKNKCLCTIN